MYTWPKMLTIMIFVRIGQGGNNWIPTTIPPPLEFFLPIGQFWGGARYTKYLDAPQPKKY